MGVGWFGCCCNTVKFVECPLCQDEVALQEMKSGGTHRKICAKKHEKLLESHPEKPSSQCPKCSQHLREWRKPSLFVCYSARCGMGEQNFSGQTKPRFCCFVCDVTFCSECVVQVIKVDETTDKKEESFSQSPLGLIKNVEEQNPSDNNAGECTSQANTNTAFMIADEDIPLIDDNMSLEDVTIIAERIKANRPKFLNGNAHSGFYFNPLGLDSPDIFKLRAPLVSCENILTPGISTELLLAN